MAILLCHTISAEANPALAAATTCHHFWGAGRPGRETVKFLHQQDDREPLCSWPRLGEQRICWEMASSPVSTTSWQCAAERKGWLSGKQDATVPQLSLYPADKAALIPHLSLNTCFVYTDVWVLTASTYRHASTCTYLLSTYICVHLYTHTCMHCMHCVGIATGPALSKGSWGTRSTAGNIFRSQVLM